MKKRTHFYLTLMMLFLVSTLLTALNDLTPNARENDGTLMKTNNSVKINNQTCLESTTTSVTLNNGPGWYRIIEGSWYGNSRILISELTNNNKVTNISMEIALMSFGQGGSINILNNTVYNQNHIEEIRGGSTLNNRFVLDILFNHIDTTTTFNITIDDNNNYDRLAVLASPIFNPIDDLRGKVEIEGKALGIVSTKYPIRLSNKVNIGSLLPANAQGRLLINGTGADEGILFWTDSGEKKSQIWTDNTTNTFHISRNNIPENGLTINNNGLIGIGTTTPENALDVCGFIRSEEVIVEDEWCDFVFDKNYKLPTLAEQKSFIATNGHLKNFQSEAEMNGQIHLGDVNKRQQQTIEEVMLYLIQMEERVTQLEAENKALKANR